jgi:hypothetical protein
MRNLKRVLSLALSLVMVLGLLVITSSAADTTSFKDADEITNVEAVDVLSALKVLEGDDNGNFNPTQILTRETAAKIICYMLIGPANADKLAGSAAFTDVAADRWSAGYVAYCANLGILAGTGDGSFNPEGELTGVAFAKMLLVALGYDADIEGYVGENWATAIATDAIEAGIDANLNLSAPLAREDAAQMAFQTLTADLVTYASKGTNVTTSDGTTIVVGASPANRPVYGDAVDYNNTTDGVQQFCEKYFKNLALTTSSYDGMKRPVQTWTYQSLPVGKYATDADFTVTAAAKSNGSAPVAADVIDTISKDLDDSSATLFVNGVDGTYASDTIQPGSTVEVYLAANGTVARVVVAEYSAATVLAAPATKTESGVDYISISGVTPGYVKAANVKGETDLAKNDVVLFYKDADDVYTIEKAESISGVATGVHSTKGLLVDGSYYKESSITGHAGGYTANDFTNTYTFYLDHANRYVKAVQVTDEVADNYVVVADVAWVTGSGVDATNYVEARIVKSDASTEVVKIASVDGVVAIATGTSVADGLKYSNGSAQTTSGGNTTATQKTVYYTESGGNIAGKYIGISDTADLISGETKIMTSTTQVSTGAYLVKGSIYAYTLDSNGKYKLSTEENGDDDFAQVGTSYTNGAAEVATGVPANSSTVFVYAVTTDGNTKYTAYTGIASAPTASSGVANTARTIVKGSNGFAKLVYIAVSSANVTGTTASDLVYIPSAAYLTQVTGSTTYYVYNAIINGVAGEVKSSVNTLTKGTMYKVTSTNADTGIQTLSDSITSVVTHGKEIGISANGGNTIVVGTGTKYSYTYKDGAVAYIIDSTGTSTATTIDAVELDAADQVYAVLNTAGTTVTTLYVVKADPKPATLKVTGTATTITAADVGNSDKDLLVGAVSVSGSASQTVVVTPDRANTNGSTNVNYVVRITGAGTAVTSDANGNATYKLNAMDDGNNLTVTVTATDTTNGTSELFTYTIAVTIS